MLTEREVGYLCDAQLQASAVHEGGRWDSLHPAASGTHLIWKYFPFVLRSLPSRVVIIGMPVSSSWDTCDEVAQTRRQSTVEPTNRPCKLFCVGLAPPGCRCAAAAHHVVHVDDLRVELADEVEHLGALPAKNGYDDNRRRLSLQAGIITVRVGGALRPSRPADTRTGAAPLSYAERRAAAGAC